MADLFGVSTKVWTVADLTRNIRALLETRLGALWVQGEISNFRAQPSGHLYFTLKDQRAAISCVIFRDNVPANAAKILADGAQVQVFGNITVFEARGQYQLSVQVVQSRGLGVLQAKFEALKRKLEAEGLFDPARKRPLPRFPRRVGIVTSPSGAAIRDMLNVLQRRAPNVQVLINPVRVQGTGAAAEIATAIRDFNSRTAAWEPVDLIVLARGGGSIEDLWEFNEEIVARAIFHSELPVVSAVGHEIDFTISDFVADLRAPTPSAAAELIVADTAEVVRRLQELRVCLSRCFGRFADAQRLRLRHLSERTLTRELVARLRDGQQRADTAAETLVRCATQRLAEARATLQHLAQTLRAHHPQREMQNRRQQTVQLERRLRDLAGQVHERAQQRFARAGAALRLLGPEGTLRRGYSITTDAAGKLITTVSEVKSRMKIRTRVSDGEFESTAG